MSPRTGIALLLVISVVFGANHVAARLAIDHGASVAGAVAVRSACTALFLLALLKGNVGIGREILPRALLTGCLVAVQSFCLYSAVAIIPVGLALLVFQTFPLLYVLLSWAAGKEKPHASTLLPIPVALLGLALALNVLEMNSAPATSAAQMGQGVAWAFGAALAFTFVVYLNAHWLKALDGRVRTFYMMAVTAVLVLVGGGVAGSLALPHDVTGWVALALLTLFYGSAITSLFLILPRLHGAAGTIALNFEPIAALGIAWVVLGQAIRPLQMLGAFIVVGAIAWLTLAKR